MTNRIVDVVYFTFSFAWRQSVMCVKSQMHCDVVSESKNAQPVAAVLLGIVIIAVFVMLLLLLLLLLLVLLYFFSAVSKRSKVS